MTTNYKIFNNTVFALAIALLCYYIVTFFMMPPIIHPEFYRTFPAMLAETEQGLFHDAISKTFNLLMIEDGAYRPRALAFFMHWIDTHTIAALSQYTTLFGVRLPLILFSALTFVAMAFLLPAKISINILFISERVIGALLFVLASPSRLFWLFINDGWGKAFTFGLLDPRNNA